MINEDRVKELVPLALYEQKADGVQEQTMTYFKSDYVGKEMIKSFFSGSFAFAFLAALYVLYHMEEILDAVNHLDYVKVGMNVAAVYLAFMAVYLFVTALIYTARYNRAGHRTKNYRERLKRLVKMYEREEKIKQ